MLSVCFSTCVTELLPKRKSPKVLDHFGHIFKQYPKLKHPIVINNSHAHEKPGHLSPDEAHALRKNKKWRRNYAS